jgi:transcriptional regulator with GAF, ATPase, and Fis domain
MHQSILETACQRRDEAAYLAGLKSVADKENRRMRRVVNPSSHGEPKGRTVGSAKHTREKERERNRKRILAAFKPGEAVSAADIADRLGTTPRRIGGVLSWLAQNNHLIRYQPVHWDGASLWGLRK